MLPAVFEERFEALRKTGSGSTGIVFRARDRRAGGFVAVKILSEKDAHDVERFAREGDILAALGHPGIVRYVAHGVTCSGEHYLAMEWLDGEDLACRLARRGLTGPETLSLARRAAAALAFAHERGLVHRDLKPSNLFLVGGDVDRTKIVDFGIARLGREDKRLTSTGALLGTPGYIAPEQIHGPPAHDPRADVFSLGCVIFECLAGRPAFEGTRAAAVLAKILLQAVPRVRDLRPNVPEALDDLLSRMMSRDPAARPPDAAAVLAELDALDARDALRALGTPPAGAPRAPEPPSLTLNEQRLVTLVLAGDADDTDEQAPRPAIGSLSEAVEPLGGRVHALAGGSVLITQWGRGSAVDRAERAARCALLMKDSFPALPVCVITGRGEIATQVIDGDLIERAILSLGVGRAHGVYVDETTAGLIGGRIRVDRRGAGHFIFPQPAPVEGVPLLLGRSTPFVGRARELSMLEGIFSGTVSEPAASAVVVIGEPGSGKTRLRREMIESMRRRGERVEVLAGACEALGTGAAFGILGDVVRRAAGFSDGEPIAARRSKLTARAGRHLDPSAVPHVAAFLGELSGTPFPESGDEVLRAARVNARLMGDSMRTAWEEWIAAECAAQPVLLVLDNLQWADAASIRLIDATLRNLRDLPLMVLALARPEIADRFPTLFQERGAQEIQLGAISRKASEQLVRAVLGDAVDPSLAARVIDRAQGNPFYLEELVRAVAAGRDAALPDSVLGTVEARLDAESGECKRVLRAASVYGQRFTRRGVLALLAGRSEAEVEASLEVLSAHELVAPVGAPDRGGDASYVFAHTLVREAAYAMLTDADRTLGHLLAGEFLEQHGPGDALSLAEHFQRGGDTDRAACWYRRAAEAALEADDLSSAAARVALGIACGAAGEELGLLRVVQAEADIWRGELCAAEVAAAAALSLLPPGCAAWFRACNLAAAAAGKLGAFDSVEQRLALAVSALPARGAASAQLMCLSVCAAHLVFGGRYAAADSIIARLRRVVPNPSVLEAPVAAELETLAAVRAAHAGDPGAALEHMEAALAALESAGDRRNACAVRCNLGTTFAHLGDFESAEEVLRTSLIAAERLGLADLSATATLNLGLALAHRGKLPEAEKQATRAVEAFHRLGDPRLEGCARGYLAQIALLSRDPARAEREAALAVDLLRVAPPLRAPSLAVYARALLRLGRMEEARAAVCEAVDILDTLGGVEEGEALIRLVQVEVLAASSDRSALDRAAADARDRLLARADRISDPAWRERFLTAVPENARTLGLI